jgi:hypothetical protein
MATQIDVKSYERRIAEEEEYAAGYLRNGNYTKLLASAGKLIELSGGLKEAQYQLEQQQLEQQ